MPTTAQTIQTLQSYITQAQREIDRLWATEGFRAGTRIEALRNGIARSQQEINRLRSLGPAAGIFQMPAVSNAANPNFANVGDVLDFSFYTGSVLTALFIDRNLNDLRNSLEADGLRVIGLQATNGSITGRVQVTRGHGPFNDVLNTILGMAINAGFNPTSSTARIVPIARSQPPGYGDNPLYNPDGTPRNNSSLDLFAEVKRLFGGISTSTMILIGGTLFALVWLRD